MKKDVNLLVIDSRASDWVSVFGGKTTKSGRRILVEQADWSELQIGTMANATTIIKVEKSSSENSKSRLKILKPDFRLVDLRKFFKK